MRRDGLLFLKTSTRGYKAKNPEIYGGTLGGLSKLKINTSDGNEFGVQTFDPSICTYTIKSLITLDDLIVCGQPCMN